MFSLFVVAASAAVAAAAPQAGGGFNCIDNGIFPHATQCDIYYDCTNGIATEHYCPDGLAYDRTGRKCDYPFLTSIEDCDYLNANNMQATVGGTLECPRQNGYFIHEDETNCREYYWCTAGVPTKLKCNEGLYFDEFRGNCHWAFEGFRSGCVVRQNTRLEDGFVCPNNTQLATNGQNLDHPRYADEADCRIFYICKNGNEPEKSGCPEGLVFNDVALICDDPAQVPGCENYYGDLDTPLRN